MEAETGLEVMVKTVRMMEMVVEMKLEMVLEMMVEMVI